MSDQYRVVVTCDQDPCPSCDRPARTWAPRTLDSSDSFWPATTPEAALRYAKVSMDQGHLRGHTITGYERREVSDWEPA